MRVNCKTCKQDVESYLSLLPRLWRKKVAEIVCKYIICGKDDISCEELTDCQTVTSLSEFTVEGTQVCIQYVDENNVTVTRCFDLQDSLSNSLGDLDPGCLASAEDWANLTYAQKMQLLINKACEECEETTTTTTTAEVTTTTTTTGEGTTTTTTTSEITTTTTTTEEVTTTTTTTELYDYYLANQRSCDDCGTVDDVVVVRFFAGTGVVIGDFYIDVPHDGNTYELISLTTPAPAVDLASAASHSGSCAVSCADGATTTTTTTAEATTTTTTTEEVTTTTTTTEEATTTTTTTSESFQARISIYPEDNGSGQVIVTAVTTEGTLLDDIPFTFDVQRYSDLACMTQEGGVYNGSFLYETGATIESSTNLGATGIGQTLALVSLTANAVTLSASPDIITIGSNVYEITGFEVCSPL